MASPSLRSFLQGWLVVSGRQMTDLDNKHLREDAVHYDDRLRAVNR
jgi:hypothetical protein